ncbi:MAG TPA: aminodeoxychorismate synthase component I [Nevskiaceae bacterium]|nr:aminodeoxychorismate synthase component I [Nevskiaceae bacterium]
MLRAATAGPVDLFTLHRRFPGRYPFLLQSAAPHPQAARYDLLFAFPGDAIELRADSRMDFFGDLNRAFRRERDDVSNELPFAGGWFILLGYEAARLIEPRVHLQRSPFRLPDALAVRCPAAIIYDRHTETAHAIAERDPAQIETMSADLRSTGAHSVRPGPLTEPATEDDPERYRAGVRAILEYLRAGDVFQVNLSRRWQAPLREGVSHCDLYDALRSRNPAPFAGLAWWQNSAVVSSSPERLVHIEGDRVQTRPIAGTRPRAADPSEDRRQIEKLMASIKERAEHIMLIDLERNDLGRVCESGSVEVDELMTTESYAHVHHIVSNVAGRLRSEAGPGDVLRAVFPGGTITGCPKVRAMEIIAELEGVGRGPYTGAMGYLCRSGRLDMNILIRSLVCEDGTVTFRAGGGIVADSDPDAELAEARAKARGLLLALGAAA